MDQRSTKHVAVKPSNQHNTQSSRRIFSTPRSIVRNRFFFSQKPWRPHFVHTVINWYCCTCVPVLLRTVGVAAQPNRCLIICADPTGCFQSRVLVTGLSSRNIRSPCAEPIYYYNDFRRRRRPQPAVYIYQQRKAHVADEDTT